jgi:hypothetical protein
MSSGFSAVQQEFTGYIREPAKKGVPHGVKPERMAMYRELVFNNIDSFLAGNFPVIRKILSDKQWFELVQDFFARHKSETPYFAEIAEEFLAYLERERTNPDDFPFLLELAHYEWVEMALSIAMDEPFVNPELTENILDSNITLSPVAWLLAYQYPVHQISPDFLPLEPPGQVSFFIAFRDLSDQVKFIEINPMVYRLLEIIQEQGSITIRESLERIADEVKHLGKDTVLKGGLETLTDLIEKSVIGLS